MPKPVVTESARAIARDRLARRLHRLSPGARVSGMLRVGSGSRPDVALAVVDGVDCVVKDHAGCDRWFALWLGPLLARREVRALERLATVEGVPRVVRVLDRRAFAMSRLDASPYRGCQGDAEFWRQFFDAMYALVSTMHAHGVAHCDLRSPDNTLVTMVGRPAVVDFVASYTRGSQWNPWRRWVFARLCEVDRSAIAKQMRTVCPELLGDDDVVALEEGWLGTLARGFGVWVRRIARRLFTDDTGRR